MREADIPRVDTTAFENPPAARRGGLSRRLQDLASAMHAVRPVLVFDTEIRVWNECLDAIVYGLSLSGVEARTFVAEARRPRSHP